MINFKEYLAMSKLNEAKLLHLEHIEDNIINLGYIGAIRTIDNIKNVIDYLKNNSGDGIKIQIKVDGSPAIIAGYLNDKFFVSTKSLFNKTPKICYSIEDIKTLFKSELHDILIYCLKYLPEVIPDGAIYQGDFLFLDKTLKTISINSKKYITFKPNTILYAIEEDNNKFASLIKSKKMGIAFHTEYTGTTIQTLSASILNYKVKSSKNVYAFNTTINEMPKLISDKQYNDIYNKLKILKSDIKKFDKNDLKFFTEIKNEIKSWYNYKLKNVEKIDKNVVSDFIKFLQYKNNDKINKLKTDKAKQNAENNFNIFINEFRKRAGTFYYLVKWQNDIKYIKNIIIDILNDFSKLLDTKAFYKTKDGFVSANPEGYVVVDKNNMIKFVNRLEFSYNNFKNFINENIVKKYDIVFTFGRMNPFTVGHENNIKEVIRIAKEYKAKPVLILSKTEDKDKNPLPYEFKLKIAKKIFNIYILEDKSIKNPFQYIEYLKDKDIKNVIFVIGDDRLNDFKNLKPFAEKNGINLKILSSGERKEGISGTNMRNFVKMDDFNAFYKNCPSKCSKLDALSIFNKIKSVYK